jgi:tetratricopeptide (TPR) repeat protein
MVNRWVGALGALVLVAGAPAAWSNGGGPMPEVRAPREQTPQEQARELYNQGLRDVKKADKANDSAATQTDPGRKDKTLHKAQELYSSALLKFQQAVQLDPSQHEGWNYLGYSSRKLGNYDDALAAYEKALSLKPGYPDALEYRGEAFLGLNRISDAQQAYLDLFAGNRALAAKLLTALRGWLDTQRQIAPPETVSELDKWIQERATIAEQTASLTRAGTAASWR